MTGFYWTRTHMGCGVVDARSAIGGNINLGLYESRREREKKDSLFFPSSPFSPSRATSYCVAYQKSTRICSHSLIPLPSTVSPARHSRYPRSSPIAIAAGIAMAIAECHRDHRHIFAMHHERRAVRRPNKYPALSHFRNVRSPYISLDSHPRGPK